MCVLKWLISHARQLRARQIGIKKKASEIVVDNPSDRIRYLIDSDCNSIVIYCTYALRPFDSNVFTSACTVGLYKRPDRHADVIRLVD